MEAIYDPKSFRTSEHLALDDYFKSYREVCHFAELIPQDNYLGLNDDEEYLDRIRQEMNMHISNEELRMLEKRCR